MKANLVEQQTVTATVVLKLLYMFTLRLAPDIVVAEHARIVIATQHHIFVRNLEMRTVI